MEQHQDIPENVRTLIASYITSVVQLELLLLLRGNPGVQRTAHEISRELRVDGAWVGPQLRELCDVGLLKCNDAPNPAFWYEYEKARPELHQAVEGLADAYAQRRVTVIGLIFSRPADPIRRFTDAFRIRRDKE